jgi:tetratricopeptide (TPR) repeat protein
MTYNLRIPGQFTERELWAIEEVAKLVPPGGVVVEVGSSLGMSSYVWAKNVHPSVTVYCIDVWENDPEYAQQLGEKYQTDYTVENFRSFTEKCPNIVTLPGFSPQDFAEWDKSIDVYCQNIDGPKTIIEEDINFWSQFVKPGGIICGFGYGEEFLDVKNKVDNLSQFYQVEPVIVEQFWCLVTDGNFERLNNVAKIKEIHGYEYELEIPEPPPLLAPGDLLQVSGKLKNISGRDWNIFVDDVEVMKIGIQVYEENKPGRIEFRQEIGVKKLLDNETVQFESLIRTNQLQQGKIRLVFDIVAEAWYWFDKKGANSRSFNLEILPITIANLIKADNKYKRKGKLIVKDLQRQNRLHEAIAFSKRCIQFNPKFPDFYWELTVTYITLFKWDSAIINCQKAVELKPDYGPYYFQLGNLLKIRNRIEEAISCFQKAVELKSNNCQYYHYLGILLKLQGKSDEAFASWEKEIVCHQQTIETNPNSYHSYYALGHVLQLKGQVNEAVKYYQKGIQIQKAINVMLIQKAINVTLKLPDIEAVKKPNFIVIGVTKGGTTSLYNYLILHPHILPASNKELAFFGDDFTNGKTLEWYINRFPSITDRQKITGEATPTYISHPLAAEQLFNLFPEVKLIVVLRNPIERTISHYFYHKKHSGESRSLEEAVTSEIAVIEKMTENNLIEENYNKLRYIGWSLYVYQLKIWMSIFPREQFLILKSEDLFYHPEATMKLCFEFLGLPDYRLSEYRNFNPNSYPAIDNSIRQTLADYFRPYNQKLEEYLDMEFNWE